MDREEEVKTKGIGNKFLKNRKLCKSLQRDAHPNIRDIQYI
jgi:hypothetical protein